MDLAPSVVQARAVTAWLWRQAPPARPGTRGKINSKLDFKSIGSRQASVMDDLRRLLRQGEYPPFSSALVFESKFVQVNERGKPISIHNRPICVTIGICAANPSSSTPNVMLVACEVPMTPEEIVTNFWKLSEQPYHTGQLALTRLFPLKFVELSVLSKDKHQLMLKLVNGRTYCLELCAPPNQHHQLFHLWLRLISLMKPTENTSNTEVNVKRKDSGMYREIAPSPTNTSENRDNPQDVRNPKTQEEVVTKQTSSNQVPLSGKVHPTEESGRKQKDFDSSLKPTRQENTMQSKNTDPLDTKESKSTEKSKT
ncbi:PREDICTED: protein FAM71C-like, partial [Tauraco erythrolophus]|uniref:protein FAM71C-like n=1 Tax=Tauraco erythrolophus TaxID=121530 RepID=UPI000523DBE7